MGGGSEESLSAIVGVRAELAAGDLRPLYLAWLSGTAGGSAEGFLRQRRGRAGAACSGRPGSLTAPQRALADFLRLDPRLLQVRPRPARRGPKPAMRAR